MAQTQFGDIVDVSFTNSLRAVADMGGDTEDLTDPSDYTTVATMDTFLSTFDSDTYTADVLAKMNINDKVFAIRNIEDPTTIADYMTAQVSRTA
jgi:hypothetical protein